MSNKTKVIGCLVAVLVLIMGSQIRSGLQQDPRSDESAGSKTGLVAVKIAVVDVRKVFRDCKRNVKYRSDALAEQSKSQADDEKLRNEIDALKQALKALKPGSTDHLKLLQQLMQKQAAIEAGRQFDTQNRTFKDQRWTEDLYQEILKVVAELAKQKELNLVLEKNEPEFPSDSPDELMLTLNTHKVLYCGGCPDITDEVIAQIDKEK